MMPDEKIFDSPVDWVAKHIKSYVKTDGATGHERWGMTNLLLTTRGRRTGKLRRTALFYLTDDERLVVVASSGGQPQHPLWYLNLHANPDVWVQVGADTFPARARTVDGDERERLWEMMADRWPEYRRYQQKAGRIIPVVVLERHP